MIQGAAAAVDRMASSLAVSLFLRLTISLYVTSCATVSTGSHSRTLRLGYLQQVDQPRVGAIQLAVDQARADGLLPEFDIRCATDFRIGLVLLACYSCG